MDDEIVRGAVCHPPPNDNGCMQFFDTGALDE